MDLRSRESGGNSPPKALGCLVSELLKIQDFECISQIIEDLIGASLSEPHSNIENGTVVHA